MKKFVCLGLILMTTSLFAEIIQVKKMKRDGELERSYLLVTNLPETIVLDCQSFIQGLRFGEGESASTLLMDQWECEELHSRMKKSLNTFRKHCIDVEEDSIRADYSC